MSLPSSVTCARGRPTESGERLDQLVLTVAGDAGDPQDLAGSDLEIDAADRLVTAIVLRLQPVHLEHRLAGFDMPRSTTSETSRPTISSARSPSFVSVGSRSPTTLPRRMTVIRSAISRTS